MQLIAFWSPVMKHHALFAFLPVKYLIHLAVLKLQQQETLEINIEASNCISHKQFATSKEIVELWIPNVFNTTIN